MRRFESTVGLLDWAETPRVGKPANRGYPAKPRYPQNPTVGKSANRGYRKSLNSAASNGDPNKVLDRRYNYAAKACRAEARRYCVYAEQKLWSSRTGD
jgi:hypothetical protein